MEPFELTAAAAASRIAAGTLSVEELTRSCLDRVAQRDAAIRAWTAIDPTAALRRARELDKILIDRGPLGPLHGIGIGVKDMIATRDLPTGFNSPLYAGFQPNQDAACVRIARGSGAIILGKTETVEFAVGGRKALTRNPHDLARTPGGSSSGSAAAVADAHVPLAFGTQTGGSLIRPASFCGIYAMKPTIHEAPWFGCAGGSPTLDTLGWYGRCVADLRLMARAFRLRGLDEHGPRALKDLKVGCAHTHNWEKCEPSAREALQLAAKRLAEAGAHVIDLELEPAFSSLNECQATIMAGEGIAHFLPDYLESKAALHPDFIAKVENASGVTSDMLRKALDHAALCRIVFDKLFTSSLDVVLTPAAPGEAPVGLTTTGDWVMNSMWTLLHVPCIAIPVDKGPGGCPVGVQIVGPRFGDAALLAAAEAIAPVIDPAPAL